MTDREKQLITTSAIMALEAYGDLRADDTGEQMASEDKGDIIRCNENSWAQRVLEQIAQTDQNIQNNQT